MSDSADFPDVTDLRRRLEIAVQYAELDRDYRDLLRHDPVDAFAKFAIDPVDLQFVSSLDLGRDAAGCVDGTCWITACPETCFVTACFPSGFEGDPAGADRADLVDRPVDAALHARGLRRIVVERD